MNTKNNKKIDPKNQLTRLLDKPELTRAEKRWLLGYLENTDGEELREIMLASFRPAESPTTDEIDLYEKMIEMIRQKIG